MSSTIQIKKKNLQELTLIFKEKILLNSYRIENLKKSALEGELDKDSLRPIAWKLFLEVLPNTSSIREWVEVISTQREEFKKKIKKFCKIKKFKGDPLGGGSKKKKNETSSEDIELKELINKDLDRTHQDMDLFLQNKIKNILANVLYIWSKENQDVSYRQGMNELLAVLFLSFYPYYFVSTCKPKSTKNDIIDYLKDINFHKEEIYIFFHDEEEIQSDLFFIFEALMKKGMKNLFNPLVLTKDNPDYKLYEIFPGIWKDDSDEEKPTYVYRRCSLLIKEKLKSLDNDLYSHFKKIELNCGVFLQRWLRCIFCREFDMEKVLIIWDVLLQNEYTNSNIEKYSFFFMESISIAMIFKIRDKLKDADQNDCFSTLFKYPHVNDIMEIIKLSQKVEQAINERLKGKNSNVYDILGIMKPIESQPTHIFSPHMYNQNIVKNSNTNNEKSKKNVYQNDDDNMEYTLQEDEKENINLDSRKINDNEGDDLGSQAKSFFNNALSSLGNFSGMIKDHLQNAKDTVMEKFDYMTNDQNNQNQYNSNDYYDNTNNGNNYYNNYNEININNTNNTINNNNNNQDSNKESENVQNQESIKVNNEVRKLSSDSGFEVGYNKQDMSDIVSKLSEFDVKYNMFFNDQDKKDFRVVINYLKEKL